MGPTVLLYHAQIAHLIVERTWLCVQRKEESFTYRVQEMHAAATSTITTAMAANDLPLLPELPDWTVCPAKLGNLRWKSAGTQKEKK